MSKPEHDLRLLSSLPNGTSFSAIQMLAREFHNNYQDSVDLSCVDSIEKPLSSIDKISMSMLPSEWQQQDLKPVKATGDGNCLFNSASIAICGSEKLASELRLRTAIELALHPEFYSSHPIISEVDLTTRSGRRKYSKDAIYDAVILSDNASRKFANEGFQSAIEQEILNTMRQAARFSSSIQTVGTCCSHF